MNTTETTINGEDFIVITNTQTYQSLTPGVTYTIHYYLNEVITDPQSGSQITSPLHDENNNLLYDGNITFTPEKADGSIDLVLYVKKSDIEVGKTYSMSSNLEISSTTLEVMESGFEISHTTTSFIVGGVILVCVALLVGLFVSIKKKNTSTKTVSYINDVGDTEKIDIEEVSYDEFEKNK